MSVDVHCFAGPYFACGLQHEKKIVVEKATACPNAMCRQYKQLTATAFCASCGNKIVVMDVERLRDKIGVEIVSALLGKTDLYFDFYLMKDSSYVKEKKLHIWRGWNVSGKEFRYRDEGLQLDCFPIVTAEDIENQKKFFLEKYEREYKVLKEVYGEDQVEVKWGIFNSYSY